MKAVKLAGAALMCGWTMGALTMTAFAGDDSVWYLDGVNGSDSNDGKTRETAVKTFEKAWTLLEHCQRQTIYICPATYDVTWDGVIEFRNMKYTHFIGLGEEPTDVVFDLGGEHKSFLEGWYEGSTLENLTVQNGSADGFAAVLPWRGGMVSNCVFRSNSGGALQFNAVNTKVVDCVFEDNGSAMRNSNGGAVDYEWKDDASPAEELAEITGCTFRRNKSGTSDADWANATGGAVYFQFSTGLIVRDSLFEENEAQRNGGALQISEWHRQCDADYIFVVSNCVFVGNTAKQGAAINMGADERTRKELEIYDCVFSNNVCTSWGAVNAPLKICQDSVFHGNSSERGAAYTYNFYSGTWSELPDGVTPPSGCGYFTTNLFVGCTFERNESTTEGGCVDWSYNNNLSFSNCTFRANVGPKTDVLTVRDHYYVGFDNCLFEDSAVTAQLVNWQNNVRDKLYFRNCTVRNNTYGESPMLGFDHADVFNCVFTNNVGAAPVLTVNGNNSATTNILLNCLFADNRNSSTSNSGAFYADWQCFYNLRIENCTFACNRSAVEPYGLGGFTFHYAKSFCNNLVFGNVKLDDPTAGGVQVYSNYLGNDTDTPATFNCYFQTGAQNQLNDETLASRGCIVGDNPKFNDAAHGDYTLRRASKARNAGLLLDWMTETATDLAGNPRVRDGAVSIGCYECWIPAPGSLLLLR